MPCPKLRFLGGDNLNEEIDRSLNSFRNSSKELNQSREDARSQVSGRDNDRQRWKWATWLVGHYEWPVAISATYRTDQWCPSSVAWWDCQLPLWCSRCSNLCSRTTTPRTLCTGDASPVTGKHNCNTPVRIKTIVYRTLNKGEYVGLLRQYRKQ